MPPENLVDKIFNLGSNSSSEFEECALKVFHYQAKNCQIYNEFIHHLSIESASIETINNIPFLPIEFFKSKRIITKGLREEIAFTSSGTSGNQTSRHLVPDLALYENSFQKAFELYYGKPEEYCILALLPSYLERKGSSLVYMAEKLIAKSKNPDSGFYLDDLERLSKVLKRQNQSGQKCLLLGVSFALLDLAEQFPQKLKNTIIMETGGMKGRRKELIRDELHSILKSAFQVEDIHSEYGMTELLSQAYSKGNGLFNCPPWMNVLIRDINDPFEILSLEKSGGINVVDLANIHSCSFIATQDLGRIKRTGFEVLGRFDNSDIRGCNLMVG